MKKNKKVKNQSNNSSEKICISEIDYDKLAKAIVKAHNDIEKQKQDEIGKETDEWRKTIGLKVEENWLTRFINRVACLFRILFMKRKDATTSKTAYSLIQLSTEFAFDIVKFILYGIALLFFALGVYSIVVRRLCENIISYFVFGVLIWVIARLFRIAAFEISNMKNREQILAICSSVTAIVALFISVITFLIGVVK